MVIPSLISKVIRGDNPLRVWGDGSAERDFLFSTDAAVGIILACIKGTKSKVVNLGSGKATSIKKLLETLQEILPFKVEFDTTKPAGFPKRVMDMTLAKKILGFEPSFSLKEGLLETVSWYETNSGSHLKKKNYYNSSFFFNQTKTIDPCNKINTVCFFQKFKQTVFIVSRVTSIIKK